MDLSKKIFGANVDKTIREYFESLQEGTFEIQPGQSISPKRIGLGKTSVGESYLGDRTPYARMWVAVNGYEVKKVEGKYQRINDGKVNIYSVNENLSDSYSELDSTQKALLSTQTYQPQLQSNPYLKPPAGIESINSKSEGAVGALRRTTVNFIVHNKQDFENIFLPFFLKPGATVFVDFGWSDKALTLYNPNDKVSNKNLDMAGFYESIYPNNDDIKKGFTTTVSGQVTKYDVNIDQNGSFKCSLEFVSSNYSLLDKSISDDNNLKFIFENSIEELLMGYFLNFSGVQIDTEKLIADSSKLTVKERSKLVKDFFDDEEKVQSDLNQTIGTIDSTSKLSGIFYQNLIKGNAEEDKLSEKESLYISYGLFEDKFLNQFISYWVYYDDDGEEVGRAEEKKNPFSNSFSSFNSWARYSEDLLLLQKQKYDEGDSIISFLYPDTWNEGETYNKVKPFDWSGTDVDKQKSRIPLRDLFISVPLISEAFRKSQNVNDALEFIFDKIYQDSGNIINIKMTTNNEAMTSLTFTDVYVASELFDDDDDDILTFDTTSGNTIVLNSDLKFETPKAGLSSMIAIGNLSEPSFFDEQELQNFNFLNSISSPAEKSNREKKGMRYQVKHLPDFGEPPKRYKSLTLNMKKFMETEFTNPKKSNVDVSEDYNTYLEERQKLIDKEKTLFGSLFGDEGEDDDTTSDVGTEEQELETETLDGRQIFYAKSSRDFRMLHAKVNSFIKTTSNTISPVLPVSLTLKVYGNNFLGIGDFFTINFLPKHYQERVYFQIVGLDHSVGTSMWETTYTTVMRLKSNEKSRTHGQVDEKVPEIRLHPLFQKQKAENMIDEISSKENLAGKYCVKNYKKEETSRITLTKLPVGVTRDDIPNLLWEKESFVWDAKNDEEKRKKEGDNTNNNPKKLINNISLEGGIGSGELAYFITISNLILGDELINWELLQSKGLPYELEEIRDSYISLGKDANKVYVMERNDDVLSNFRDYILEKFDQPTNSFFGLDDFQEKLYERLGFLGQEVSDFLGKKENFEENLFLIGLIWDVSAESPLYQNDAINSEKTGIPFVRFTVTEHSDTRVMPSIVVPRELLKIQSVDVLGKKVWREYCGLKAGFKELFESDEREL